MVEFGGWDMPVSYAGILEEHRTVREAIGLFDVSHMGEIELRGPRAGAACQRLTTNDVARLVDGQVQYTLLCREDGGVVDDVTLYRQGAERYFFCVNAGNIAKDLAWIEGHADGATVDDRSAATALLALQGPRAAAVLARLTAAPLAGLRAFRFVEDRVADVPTLISRTGYTGEDGFELYVQAADAVRLWEALLAAGRPDGLQPIGLGARDTLRLEAALPLYGHELDDATTPLTAGLARFVKLDGDDFIGRATLRREQVEGSRRRLVGLEMLGAGIARQDYPVLAGTTRVGRVTSGTRAPTLGKAIGLAYVEASHAAIGTVLGVEVRGRSVDAALVPTPFYRRERALGRRPGAEKGDR
jgi:glycine cleavage system T protein (aminomethyltransferase)